MNDRYLITGSAGFIGFHLSRALLEQGNEVIGYDNMNDYYTPILKRSRVNLLKEYKGYTFFEEDVTNYKVLEEVIKKYKIQFVIHLAAQAGVRYSITNPQTYIDSNIIGMFNILEACRKCEVQQLIYASSSSVYGNSDEEIFNEDQMVDRPISLYAATKKSNELFAHVYSNNYKLNTMGLRFFTVYGPYGRPDMAYYSFVEKILRGEKIQIYNYGNQYRDFTYIDDLIDGILRLIEMQQQKERNGEYKIFNIGNGNPTKLMDFVSTLEDVVGKKANLEFTDRATGDVDKTYADISLLKQYTGYNPNTSIREGIARFYDWYKDYYNKFNIYKEVK